MNSSMEVTDSLGSNVWGGLDLVGLELGKEEFGGALEVEDEDPEASDALFDEKAKARF